MRTRCVLGNNMVLVYHVQGSSETPLLAETPLSLDDRRDRIDARLRDLLKYVAGCPAGLAEAIEYSMFAPCKRLRPMLAMMAAEAVGGDGEIALAAGCAVEMVHTYSLIHDDLPAMDDDDLRRGRPTCHKKFGEALAILTGDALLALAFQVLAGEYPPATAAACRTSMQRRTPQSRTPSPRSARTPSA